MSVLVSTVRRLAAAALTLVVVAVVPVALWRLSVPLLPDQIPDWQDVVDVLTRPDDGSLLLGFLAVAGAVAWALLAFSLLTELISVVLRRPALRVDLPGFRMGRAMAATLVAAMLGAGTAPALAAQPAVIAAVAPALPGSPASAGPATERPDGPQHVVAPRDTLWRIAETKLGDPLRWREIYVLNAGRTQPDGRMLTEASVLQVGWHLTLPSDAATDDDIDVVTVAAGDTLSGVAALHLNDPSRATEIFTENQGRPQPHGGKLEDPDLIRPGWLLTLPEAPPPRPGHGRTPALELSPDVIPPPETPLPAVPSETQPAPSAGPEKQDGPAPAASPSAESDDTVSLPTVLVASSLVMGGVLGGLAVRRRRQLRHRRGHHRIAVPNDAAGRLEWLGRRAHPPINPAFLDAALRTLQLANWHGIDLPDLRSLQLCPDRAVLSLAARASMPPPFEPIGDADDWLLEGDSELSIHPDEAGGLCAPFPLLVSLATTEESSTLLVDLEHLGALHVTGPPDRTVNLLRHVAAELANSRWAEDVEVLLVGFGSELVPLNPERLRIVDDLTDALQVLDARLNAARTTVREQPVRSVLDGRIRDVAGDAWLPVLLLASGGASAPQFEVLNSLCAALSDGQRHAAAMVTAGLEVAPVGHQLRLDEDGSFDLAGVDNGPWRAEGLTAQAGAGIAAILAPTSAQDVSAGPAEHLEGWARDMTLDGRLDPGPVEPVQPADPARSDASVDDGEARIVSPPDETALRRLAVTDHQDPDLDRDVERWWSDGEPVVPMIAILGEPVVRAPGDLPSARPSWFTEVLVYLSLNPLGVTISKATADLWPDGRKITSATVRHAFYGARRWAGRGLNGDPKKAFVSDMQSDSIYRIRGHLLDWDLFRRLRKRAQARHSAHHPGATADYKAALRLVRGPALSSLRHDGYAWLNNHDQRHDLQIPGYVVDTAHELVDIALDRGDLSLARVAAETARLVDLDAAFDRPLTDLMRIAHAEDNAAEMERYAAILLDARGFDVPEELPPETFAVLNELLPAGPRRRIP